MVYTVQKTKLDNNNSFVVPNGDNSVIFVRMNPAYSELDENWTGKWNQTATVNFEEGKDTYTIINWEGAGADNYGNKLSGGQWSTSDNYGTSEGGFNVTVTMPETPNVGDSTEPDNPSNPDPIPSGTARIYVSADSAPKIWVWTTSNEITKELLQFEVSKEELQDRIQALAKGGMTDDSSK